MKNTDKQNNSKENISLLLRISSDIMDRMTSNAKENLPVILGAISEILETPYVVFYDADKCDKPLIFQSSDQSEIKIDDEKLAEIFSYFMKMCTDKALSLPDISKAPKIVEKISGTSLFQSFFGVPVGLEGERYGALALADVVPREFTRSEQGLLINFAKFLAIENNRLHTNLSKETLKTKYQTIYENLDAGIVLLKDFKIVEINRQFLDIIDESRKNIIGKSPADFSPKFQPDSNLSSRKLKTYLQAAKRNKQTIEWTFRSKDRKMIYTEIKLTHIHDLPDADTMLFVYDISNQKNFEKELINAKDKAEKANQMKSIFLSNMSHEIRTPLNSIIGFSDLLMDEDSTYEDRALYSEMISTAGKSLLQLITDIIDISKIEAGHLKIRKTDFDVHKVLDEMLLTYFREKEAKGKDNLTLKLTKALEEEKLFIHSDEYRFRQIINNLLSNAIKFTDEGVIEFGYRSVSSEMIQFYVKDTGSGIASDETGLIFQRFGQAKQDYVVNKDGKGLGLAITHSLVRLLGGSIWLDTEPGKGSTFYFTVPIPKNSALSYNLQQVFDDTLEGKNILIVDNVEENFHFIRGTLQSTKAVFLWAKGGVEAIKACSENPDIDLVLMDLIMPDLDGYSATKLIRNMNKHLPIIAQTAFDQSLEKKKVTENGFNDIIIKPFLFRELYSVLTKYLMV